MSIYMDEESRKCSRRAAARACLYMRESTLNAAFNYARRVGTPMVIGGETITSIEQLRRQPTEDEMAADPDRYIPVGRASKPESEVG